MQNYLFQKGCQNRHLNQILIRSVTPDKYYRISIIALTNMIQSHFEKKFDTKDIYICYQHVVDKFVFQRDFLLFKKIKNQ